MVTARARRRATSWLRLSSCSLGDGSTRSFAAGGWCRRTSREAPCAAGGHHPADQHCSCTPAGCTWRQHAVPGRLRAARRAAARRGALRVAVLASGLIGSLATCWCSRTSTVPAIGASGAIAGSDRRAPGAVPGRDAGLAGARAILARGREHATCCCLLLVWLATQVFSSVAPLTTNTGIAWWAHLGGFASGLALCTGTANAPSTLRN